MVKEFDYTNDRNRMVEKQLVQRDITDARVLAAMRQIPRHLFVPPDVAYLAYTDGPLPIGEHQTISQPYIVALMTQLLRLRGTEMVLEIGTGSGYQAAVLGKLAKAVYSVENNQSLAKTSAQLLLDLGYDNIRVILGDGSQGLQEFAPYDSIIVTAAAPKVPIALFEQLQDGGVLVIPVGDYRLQILQRWIRKDDKFLQEDVIPVAFVPLRGEFGWPITEWHR